jgi:hypothetical protein
MAMDARAVISMLMGGLYMTLIVMTIKALHRTILRMGMKPFIVILSLELFSAKKMRIFANRAMK